jgi:hypothetical protein
MAMRMRPPGVLLRLRGAGRSRRVLAAMREVIKMWCDSAGPCSFHAEGGPTDENCPDGCDVKGCRRPGRWMLTEAPGDEIEVPARYCGPHLYELVGSTTEQ